MTGSPVRVAVALGSNSPDRLALLDSGREALAHLEGVRLLASSRIEETEPIGPPQPAYLNQMVLIATSLPLGTLLGALQLVELQHGRTRAIPKGPRTLDLDIVWAEKITVTSAELLVPHPGLNDRVFWQRELAELLGVGDAADVIASARVHAGLDTGPRAA